MTLLPGSERTPKAGTRYELEVLSVDDVIETAQRSLEVSKSAKSTATTDALKVANLQFSDRSPRLAAKFLERLMLGYLEERQSWKTEEATAAEVFVTSQLRGIRETLDEVEKKLADYRSTQGVVVLDDEAKALIEQIGKFEEQRLAARLDVETLAQAQSALQAPKPPAEAFMLGETKDTVLAGLAASLSEAEQKLTEAQSRFNAPAPEVRDQQAQVDAQLEAIRHYVASRLSRARESLSTVDGIIAQYERKLRTVPGAEVGLAQLTRESEVYSTMYSYLLKRQQEAAIVKASNVSKNRVLDPADVPYRESSPALWLRVLSAPLGLALGAFLAMLRGIYSSTLQTEGEVRSQFGYLPVFARVPRSRKRRVSRRERAERPVAMQGRSPEYVEAFRTLRTSISRASPREGGNVVVITSPCKLDGKTSCAFSLASTLAASGKSVLVVNADPAGERTPHPSAPSASMSESSAPVDRDDWRSFVRPITVTPQCSFQAIDSESDGLADLLTSERIGAFVEEARATYDFILFDAPSYPLTSDALALSRVADCVVSVIRLEHTSRKLAADHVRRLSHSVPAYGVVLNDLRS
jgi:tyrosine-protein kinase Etk/Wzc